MRKILLDLNEILGEKILSGLLNRKPEALKKFLENPDKIPTSVEDKLNLINAIVRNLRGSYNYHDIRQWFSRERSQLNGKSPVDIMKKNWWPRDHRVLEVLALSSKAGE